jgi:hypothetical protein
VALNELISVCENTIPKAVINERMSKNLFMVVGFFGL